MFGTITSSDPSGMLTNQIILWIGLSFLAFWLIKRETEAPVKPLLCLALYIHVPTFSYLSGYVRDFQDIDPSKDGWLSLGICIVQIGIAVILCMEFLELSRKRAIVLNIKLLFLGFFILTPTYMILTSFIPLEIITKLP